MTIESEFQARCARFVENSVNLNVTALMALLRTAGPGRDDSNFTDKRLHEASTAIDEFTSDAELCGECNATGEGDDGEACAHCNEGRAYEVCEYWAVDDGFADALRARGETCFVGHYVGLPGAVWCRTTMGQSISMDGCVRSIVAELPY